MIEILQTIMTNDKGQPVLIKKGKYDKVPAALKADKDFMHYVNSKDKNGKPNYIVGYSPNKSESDKYKPLTESEKKSTVKVVEPDTAMKKINDPEDKKDLDEKVVVTTVGKNQV